VAGPGVAYAALTLDDLVACARVWEERLGLTGWDIEYRVKHLKPRTTTARCLRSEQYDRATILFNDWVLTNEPPKHWHAGRRATLRDIEETTVHELLHCHLMQLDRWQTSTKHGMKRAVWGLAVAHHDLTEEQIVDRLARALTSALPPAMMVPR
jgi:hypothetical protein